MSAKCASDPSTGRTAQELGGVEGASVDKAWQVSTGRPDIHIAVLDSGIIWDDYGKMLDLRNKVALNWAELPPPQAANGVSSCQGVALPARNQKLPSPGFPPCYDANHDGAFTVDDYAADARVNPPNHAHFCCGSAIPAQNLLTPEDLIQVFSCYDATNAVEPVGHFINISATGPRRCDNGAENADNDGIGELIFEGPSTIGCAEKAAHRGHSALARRAQIGRHSRTRRCRQTRRVSQPSARPR